MFLEFNDYRMFDEAPIFPFFFAILSFVYLFRAALCRLLLELWKVCCSIGHCDCRQHKHPSLKFEAKSKEIIVEHQKVLH